MDNVTRPARDYEMMAILLPDMAEEDTQAALDKVRGYITDVSAEITEVLTDSPWGRRRLAYTIRHENVDYRDGFYVVIHFTAQPTAIGDIEREMKLDTNVIRYLLVMDDPKAGEKSQPQPEGEAATADEQAAAEAPTTEQAAEAPAAEATEAAPAAEEAPSTETESEVEETAETIEGEEEPAPADGAEAETKES